MTRVFRRPHVRQINYSYDKRSFHFSSHMLQRSTSLSPFKKRVLLLTETLRGFFFYLPAAISCQNTQVAASSTINMMYAACDAFDLTTRATAVQGSRCQTDL